MIARLVSRVAGLASVVVAAALVTAAAPPSRSVAVPAARTPADTVFAAPVAIFVEPDSAALAELRARVGEENFYTITDDVSWYRAQAWTLLDSLGVPYRVMERRLLRFLVGTDTVGYDWRDVQPIWFVILYDGQAAPRTLASVEVDAEALAPLRGGGGGRRRDHRPPPPAQPPSVQ